MKEPTSPTANPFGACFRIASLSASVFPRAAIHAFPNTGPAYQIPPITRLTIVAAMTAIKKFASSISAMRVPLEFCEPLEPAYTYVTDIA